MSKIEKFIKDNKMTRAEFCAAVGINKSTLSRYISGERKPNTYITMKICYIFDLTIKQFKELFINEN